MSTLSPRYIWAIVCVIIGGILVAYPNIDIMVADLFVKDGKFIYNNHPVFVLIHNSVRYITICLAILMIGGLFYCMKYRTTLSLFGKKLGSRHMIFFILALALGPGLVVNTIFKDQWGRARPYQTELYGGTKQFTPAFVMTDQCPRNCSFVSGDPSVGYFLFSLFLVYGDRRWLILPITVGTIFGVTRIVQGAHFFSDVIFSAIFTMWVCWGVYWSLFVSTLLRRN